MRSTQKIRDGCLSLSRKRLGTSCRQASIMMLYFHSPLMEIIQLADKELLSFIGFVERLDSRSRKRMKASLEGNAEAIREYKRVFGLHINTLWDKWSNKINNDGDRFSIVLENLKRDTELLVETLKKTMHMRLLNEEESWDLLRVKVFGEESCPPQFEDPGKKIAYKCDGLPLTIVTVAHLLSEAGKTQESLWIEVATRKKHQLFTQAYDDISKVLVYPSYNNLKIQFYRHCFLYPWEAMRRITSLPNLEVLKLQCNAFQGPKWEIEQDGFPKLHFLVIEDIDLVHLKGGRGSFKCLKNIRIQHCYKLEELRLGQCPYLEDIDIVDCNPLVEKKVKEFVVNNTYVGFPENFSVHSSWNS
ncbi:hypothetical protein ACS0TY_005966 [Phlomoides rotata]